MLTALREKLQPERGIIALVSHKNLQVKSVRWDSISAWLQAEGTLEKLTLWILPHSVPAHAWLEQVTPVAKRQNNQAIALLGGDFPPAQERRWKQRLQQEQVHTLILTRELAEKWFSKLTLPSWLAPFDYITWVGCYPTETSLHTLLTASHNPQLIWLNVPLALPSSVEVAVPALPTTEDPLPRPVLATGKAHIFAYNVLSEDALFNQAEAHCNALKQTTINVSPLVVIFKTEAAMLGYQQLLGDKDCPLIALSASMPWVLFQHHLQGWFANPQAILLLEESTVPAFLDVLNHNRLSIQMPATWHWVWMCVPVNPQTVSNLFAGFPCPVQVDCHFIKEKRVFASLSLAWQWHLLNKQPSFNPHAPIAPAPPFSQWSLWQKLNRLLYF